jgi:hypothetical protein
MATVHFSPSQIETHDLKKNVNAHLFKQSHTYKRHINIRNEPKLSNYAQSSVIFYIIKAFILNLI